MCGWWCLLAVGGTGQPEASWQQEEEAVTEGGRVTARWDTGITKLLICKPKSVFYQTNRVLGVGAQTCVRFVVCKIHVVLFSISKKGSSHD